MNLGSLASLGKVAGIGGIAVGAVVLVLSQVFKALKLVPGAERAGVLDLVIYACFGIGVLGVIAWILGARAARPTASAEGDGSDALVAGADINYGVAPTSPGKGSKTAPHGAPTGVARTKGNNSISAVAGGTINIGPKPKPE